MPFDTRFCDGYLTIKPRKSQKGKATTQRSATSNVHHVQNIFHRSVEESDMTQVKVLLRYAQTNIHLEEPNRHGRTAMQECCIKDNLEMIRLLLDHGASLESTDQYGWTVLHYAAFFGSLSIVRFLVLNCADLMLTNTSGETAYDLAQNADVRYYLHRMMMLNNENDDDDDDDDDGDDDEDDYDYYSDDRIGWRHESDNDSLGNSIDCKAFEEMGPSDSRETVDTGYYEDSLPSSPISDGTSIKGLAVSRKQFTNQGANSSVKRANEDKVFDEEVDQSLKLIEGSYEINEEDENERRNSVICKNILSENEGEEGKDERQKPESENCFRTLLKEDDGKLNTTKREGNDHIDPSENETELKKVLTSCKKGPIASQKIYDGTMDIIKVIAKYEFEGDAELDREEEADCDEEPTKEEFCYVAVGKEVEKEGECRKENNATKIAVQNAGDVSAGDANRYDILERKIKESKSVSGENAEMADVGKRMKNKRGKEKSFSRIPSVIPRFRKNDEEENTEGMKKGGMSRPRMKLKNHSSRKGSTGDEPQATSKQFEEKNKKGLERLWERFRKLAAKKHSKERNSEI